MLNHLCQVDSLVKSISSLRGVWSVFGRFFFFFFFFKNPSFKIAMSGRAGEGGEGVGRCTGGRRASSQAYLLLNLFSKLYVTFIHQ